MENKNKKTVDSDGMSNARKLILQIVILVVLNFVFLIVVHMLWLSPMSQDIAHTRGIIQRQENQILARTRFELFYQDNLYELEMLNENRRLLDQYEFGLELDIISHMAYMHNLSSLSLTVGDPVTFDTFEFGRLVQQRVRMEKEGTIADIIELLYNLRDISANVINTDMVWVEGSRARINIELLLLWA